MSGPKTSSYTLTPEQRRILAEQREIERRSSVASEKIKRSNKRLIQIGSMFSSAKQVSDELLNRTGNDGGFAERIKELEDTIVPIDPTVIKSADVTSLESSSKTVSESLTKAEKLAAELTVLAAKNDTALRVSLTLDIDKGFETSFAGVQTDARTSMCEIKIKIIDQISKMKRNQNLSEDLVNRLNSTLEKIDTIDSEAFLKNYSSVTVAPLLKRCKQYLDEYEKCHEEFETLYTEYLALCNLHYCVPQEYACSVASIEILKSEIQRIKASAAENDEQAYISKCLDEVMEEMGYSVLGSREVSKNNGAHFRNELFTYGEGTAVNVTFSSDGRIAMELGGIDTSDRIPDEQETSALCESMEQFCTDFKEIERRLLAKGVILADRISLLPPNAEYAQIINTSDYEMSEKQKALVQEKGKKPSRRKTRVRSKVDGEI